MADAGRTADVAAAAMTLDEFKQGMFRSLRDSGAMELVRAQLRRQIIEKLQYQRQSGSVGGSVSGDGVTDSNNEREGERERGNEDRIASGLVAEFLRVRGLENTLAVFVPEAGGARNQLDSDTIMDMLHLPPAQQQRLNSERRGGKRSLLAVVLVELESRLGVTSVDAEAQTMIDCFDHRIALDNQLRRVESTYLAECESQKLAPAQTIEQRMLQYQAEYDSMCEKRLREELERFKATELALARTEERKRYDREIETLRTSLFQEHREKVRRLGEREKEMELAFTAKRTDLETSLFDTRQSLMQELEKLRTQEAEQQARREADFRKYAAETKRLEAWEETLRAQEKNLEGLIAHRIREKEREWSLERQRVEQDYQFKLEELRVRESALSQETDGLKAASLRAAELQIRCATAVQEQQKCQDEVLLLQERVTSAEKEAKQRELELGAKQKELNDRKAEIETLSFTNARLTSEKVNLERDAARFQQINAKLEEDVAKLDAEMKRLQQQEVAMKLSEASEVVAERRKLLKVLDEERERFYWKENELLAKVRDLQTRLVESEATVEKYQSQYEDERVHVESLRHDVASLNALLTQAHVTINAKHGAANARDYTNPRSVRANPLDSSMSTSAPQAPSYDGMMMKMMEFMAAMQGGLAPGMRQSGLPTTHPIRADLLPTQSHTDTKVSQESDEEKQLKDKLQRRERELLEQRENEKRQKERLEAEEREIAARRKQFEEDMTRMRLAKQEEDERAEAARKAQLIDEEAKIQRQLELQQKAIEHAREEQERLEKRRAAESELRIQQEKEEQDRLRDERLHQAEELEARIKKQRLEAEEADRQRSEKIVKEMKEIQKRREQLDLIEEEKRRVERVTAEAEEKRLCEAKVEAEAKRQQELVVQQETVRAAAEVSRAKQVEDQQALLDESTLPHESTDEDDQANRLEPSQDRAPSPELTAVSSSLAAMTDIERHSLGSNVSDEVQIEDEVQSDRPQGESTQRESNSEGFSTDELGSNSESTSRQEAATSAKNSVDKREGTSDSVEAGAFTIDAGTPSEEATPAKSDQELEEERRKREEEQKKKQDGEVIDVYRQRVLARKAAEKQRQQEMEAERKRKEEEAAAAMREAQQSFGAGDDSENELELSEGSFAESSAASSADSF